jgi:capsular polysaccharide biosynthesis protein
MELRSLWKPLRRRWWLVALPVVVVAAYVLFTYRPPAPMYQVVTRYAAGTTPAVSSEDYDRYYPWLTSEYIANGLADVALTGAFADAVVERVGDSGFQPAPAAVQQAIVSDNAQSILVVYLTWPDTRQAAVLADAISAELGSNSASYFPQLEGVEPAVRRLDSPFVVQITAGLRTQLTGPLVKIVVALVLGVGLALLWHYLDPTVHEASDVEALDLRVVGEIPRK